MLFSIQMLNQFSFFVEAKLMKLTIVEQFPNLTDSPSETISTCSTQFFIEGKALSTV